MNNQVGLNKFTKELVFSAIQYHESIELKRAILDKRDNSSSNKDRDAVDSKGERTFSVLVTPSMPPLP